MERPRAVRLGRGHRYRGPYRPGDRYGGVLLTQVELTGPTPPTIMRDFWRVAARGPGN